MTDTDTAMTRLRMTAIEQLVGRHVGSDRLIQIGLDALLAGLDTPLLRLLAGKSSRVAFANPRGTVEPRLAGPLAEDAGRRVD